ncbi:hypothetical protein Harman_39390 [Haloarcula mannanilytica]|uniref:Halobacterial output domain-containing protein n=1 Tax=Haloarcula mannanilytica TaxID=2509225 RepID=A0A4C2EN40_9EURY|nr:HalOD1 output domain-containing protein [Haloarcula mannanilytica]GCF16004.1 hypothetical protein Harman_39390 [Haloarcula mannanilytica]
MTREIESSESVSEAVVEAVSEVEDCPPRSLPPLYNTVNPEALDKLFNRTNNAVTERTGHFTFQYSDSIVTVGEDGYLTIQESRQLKNDKRFSDDN